MPTATLSFADMASAKNKRAGATIGLRLDADLLKRMREYANSHPFHPALTSLINDAMKDWLQKHANDLVVPKK